MGSWFDCKWNSDDKCDKCSGCRMCENCNHNDEEYWMINDTFDVCVRCIDNPYNDDRFN